ncbi:hypothetical protein I5M27_09895 [Adhaeribacter sp. BT258]|uniref:Uncharacterized protein n=1 Tax=Adhaeribacter terrigena TaxID=2793070 RepID=A0ABS1C1V0_9BACT|nr:hypothetical protein [Adhaeribacter terrigena]MBK0403298.1 hypothetical protein [Adhaeribacter terrigena]
MLRITSLLLVLLSLICSSCSSVYMSAYGIKNPEKLDQNQIASQARKYNIPAENSFELDNAPYSEFLKSFDQKRYYQQIYNHSQPLQALYFDKNGDLKIFYINCYAGGFPNLTWDKDGNFNSFPPSLQAPIDSLVNLQTLSRYLKPISIAQLSPENSSDFTIVVFWNRMMERQSKRFIETVQQNCAKAGNQKIQLLYVNNDDLMAEFWK